jgi:hypothetical protein
MQALRLPTTPNPDPDAESKVQRWLSLEAGGKPAQRNETPKLRYKERQTRRVDNKEKRRKKTSRIGRGKAGTH